MGTLLQQLALGYYLIKHNSQLSCLLKITIFFHAKISWTLSDLKLILNFLFNVRTCILCIKLNRCLV